MESCSSSKSIKLKQFPQKSHYTPGRQLYSPYLSLSNKIREIQTLKNSIMFSSRKKQRLESQFQIKKLKVRQLETTRNSRLKEKLHHETERQGFCEDSFQLKRQKEKLGHYRNSSSQDWNSSLKLKNKMKTLNNSKLSNFSFQVSQKQRLKEHIKNLSLERKQSKASNQILKRFQDENNFKKKLEMKKSIERFKQNLSKKMQLFDRTFQQKIRDQKRQVMSQLQNVESQNSKKISKLKMKKFQIDLKINSVKSDSRILKQDFMRSQNIRDQSIADFMMLRSNIVSYK